ncbi:hypothetical protein GCM10022415_02440 [Knoellia locipacati]|uniref:YbaB/EbfC DNA-binding family protein n=1 Tax=Knoellia locipacati TaxID=882824 RepID=A0A512SW93_9MICO|nr:hypothetical protein [Knoellia locipacati]GEQ12197.1 hypothetical protein KLO01_02440 [Knoellia locipacati]
MSGTGGFDLGLDGDIPAQGDLDRAVARARAAFAWRASVDAMTAEGVRDGVVATVSGTGGLRGLTVPTSACAGGGDAVAASILGAVADAQALLARQIRDSAVAAFGSDSAEVDTISRSVEARFNVGDERR